LKNEKLSRSLVPTKAEDLIYVEMPNLENTRSSLNETLIMGLLEKIASSPMKSGY